MGGEVGLCCGDWSVCTQEDSACGNEMGHQWHKVLEKVRGARTWSKQPPQPERRELRPLAWAELREVGREERAEGPCPVVPGLHETHAADSSADGAMGVQGGGGVWTLAWDRGGLSEPGSAWHGGRHRD